MRRWWCASAALAVVVVVAGGALALRATAPVPPRFAAVRAAHAVSDAPLLDRHGAVLAVRRIDASRRRFAWVPLATVSPAVVRAVVAAEDRRFGAHGGVDVQALAAAAWARISARGARGASTIAMQVAALLEPSLRAPRGGRTVGQKWRQMRLARALVSAWTPDEILEAWLNGVAFRGEVEGIGAAAATLFGKAPDALDETEAATLAALVAAPNADVPRLTARARAVCARAGCSAGEAQLAAAAARAARPSRATAAAASAPHVARRLLAPGGGAVRTTLDAHLQAASAAALRRNLLALPPGSARDGAVLVVDTASGDVLAYVGSSGELSRAAQVDAVTARRQAGSTLKPFLYGLAIEARVLTAAALVDDAPLALDQDGRLWRPRNYDDRFRGLVSARTALAASLNVPAVRVLQLVGTAPFLARLRVLGFAGLDRDAEHYGPALALGAADVSLWELVGAYRTLAAGGVARPLRLRADAPVEEPRRVLPADAAFVVADVLADRAGRSATFGLESVLATRGFAAVKTGTSTDMRDDWCVGFTDRYTVGVWVGNASGLPMHGVSGVDGAAPTWREIVDLLHADATSTAPLPPSGVESIAVRFPGDVEPPRREWLLDGTAPGVGRADPPPHIVAPARGTRLALDPDVPPGHQRLWLDAAGDVHGARWVVDGAVVGTAGRDVAWAPAGGRHVVALIDADGRELDRVAVEVVGQAR